MSGYAESDLPGQWTAPFITEGVAVISPDINHDGIDDLIMSVGNKVRIRRGLGNGTFGANLASPCLPSGARGV